MASRLHEIAIQIAGRINSSLPNAFRSTNDRMRQLNQNTNSVRAAMRQLERDQRAGTITAEQYARQHERLTRQLREAEQAQRRFSRAVDAQNRASAFRDRARSSLFDGVAMAATLAVPVNAAIQFESSMADVKKVVDFDTPQQFKAMGKDIIGLSKRIPMAAEGLVQIVAAAGQAGIARNELTGFAEAAAKMGVAFDISAEDAGQMMAEWRSAFNMNQQQVNTLADQINHLGNTTAAAAPRISDVVRRIGPLGDVGGVAAGQIAALGATMVGAGVAEDVAATGIKNMILSLVAGESATKSQADAFRALGMNAKDMAVMMQEDAEGAIMSVFQALQKLPKERQASVMTNLFGKESIGAISPLLVALPRLEKNLKNVADKTAYAGSMEEEFKARSETTANAIQLMKNQMNALNITVGSILLPPIVSLTEKVSGLTERFATFTEKHPALTRALVIGASSALGFGVAVTALRYAASLIISPFINFYAWATRIELRSKMAAAATRTWAIAQRLLNFAMSTNPIALVIKGIAGLITIGVVLYKNFDSVRNIVDNLWDSFKQTFPNAARFIEIVGQKVGALWSKLKNFWGWLTGKGDGDTGSSNSSSKGVSPIAYATGGILTRPHVGLVAEDGPEAIIPLSPERRQRAVTLWQRAGQILGIPMAQQGVTPHATGGILTRPHVGLVAEDGPEAIIPLRSSKRALSLWRRVGQILGVVPHADGGIFGSLNADSQSDSKGFLGWSGGDAARQLQGAEGGDTAVTINAPFKPTINSSSIDSQSLKALKDQQNKYIADLEETIKRVMRDVTHNNKRLAFD